ncbi:N-acetylglucosamine kinase [Flavobacterium sp. SM15]|uniref:BadF/BadG/BcrA/BcrD ATPase family protein n=1 Tax=Flavobacterium sp. SM15 TaxID=2908005 RepID=UPI001EDBEE25|nr:BadF/BadG/BcrA/BcrD ATPase family protein [Flavobacterium sp. SM15]MCG2611562.1 N-acetylglucosamine kinase [Flavobacterium sp. SM15]
MKLVVDSGSTKADWIALDENGNIQFTASTLGLNPEVLTREEVLTRINERFDIAQNKDIVKELYFYGAGCGTDRMKNHLSEILHDYFPNAHIEVKEDTYAAVFATTPRGEKAIVSILGTGSNCSYFDGTELHQKIQSLGYLAMDDCSGNRFGRHLIRAYYFHTMPKELAEIFEKEYDLDADVIKHNLYKEPNPNAYLATFAKFLIQHKDHEFIRAIVFREMQNFVDLNIKQFENCHEVPVHFIGSIAYYLKDELNEVLTKNGLKLGNVFRKPIDGLIHYHTVTV